MILDPLEESNKNAESGKTLITWTDELSDAFKRAQNLLQSNQVIHLPHSNAMLWLVTDGDTSCQGLGAILYCSIGGGFVSAKLRELQKGWIPCEIEALAITSAVRHFSSVIVQSKHRTTVLSNSKPCVQVVEKLRRGEFSASPRITTVLATICRYDIHISHLKGTTNVVSDFASRNAPECRDPTCQICKFLSEDTSVTVMHVGSHTVQDILKGMSPLPYSNRVTWRELQQDCYTLRKVFALLKQGSTLCKKDTKDRDFKRYLQHCTISTDWQTLVVLREEAFMPVTERVVIPRAIINGLVTALHERLTHLSIHQLKKAFARSFFALDSDQIIEEITRFCKKCEAAESMPGGLIEQSSDCSPTAHSHVTS